VHICLHSCRIIVLDVFFLLLLCFYIVCSCHVSTVLCHITVLWTPVSARILAVVLQLYERNKLKLKSSAAGLTEFVEWRCCLWVYRERAVVVGLGMRPIDEARCQLIEVYGSPTLVHSEY